MGKWSERFEVNREQRLVRFRWLMPLTGWRWQRYRNSYNNVFYEDYTKPQFLDFHAGLLDLTGKACKNSAIRCFREDAEFYNAHPFIRTHKYAEEVFIHRLRSLCDIPDWITDGSKELALVQSLAVQARQAMVSKPFYCLPEINVLCDACVDAGLENDANTLSKANDVFDLLNQTQLGMFGLKRK